MKISKQKVVSFDYTLTDNDGEVIDSSEGNEPLAYIHGSGFLIPGLENEMEGKQAGDAFKVTVAPEDAYGVRDDSLVKEVERDMFGDVENLEAGMQFQAETEDGIEVVVVTAVGEDTVTVDGNHPLADVTLNFDVKIVDVRDATAEELDHGHVHGEGGHHH
ncbi:MAG: peptidylprolyl isomerase [Zetaproteobacteria bacterium CG06_land_8_20_14_3_00_59_53]|nr:MAG: peptidylprolyl isomerase [Zetaproteobacteria bacterium CG2_30_59_37]PIO90057.1 MAG: peptidylprolyl isomerase [Zetaproteobacteria bacterium CG23_combo_of_CG06-09_8_20_14_all_59_86]PIQ65036.1 MAG: peptidylprolyl isomerase [Zetaproteobacteria bacterium CG11_big_fil_rev_8_21_14_0_20_59_439]PIU69563.1 MAG: peptidylprolyl isomerase [Zetaproteobacteria bacterium CG06_land_8_20_14_3_00_59_53]PIU96872.1 MAG: peptidylprolyl isomerase [Zetaproteobacteria bacterium CG03_land_8_20_14_0_80_59_51]PIY